MQVLRQPMLPLRCQLCAPSNCVCGQVSLPQSTYLHFDRLPLCSGQGEACAVTTSISPGFLNHHTSCAYLSSPRATVLIQFGKCYIEASKVQSKESVCCKNRFKLWTCPSASHKQRCSLSFVTLWPREARGTRADFSCNQPQMFPKCP